MKISSYEGENTIKFGYTTTGSRNCTTMSFAWFGMKFE